MHQVRRIAIPLLSFAALVGCSGVEKGEPVSAGAAHAPTIAILHFSPIEGTTWSGAHHRAGNRIAEWHQGARYVFREKVGPDLTIPYAEELIKEGANIIVANTESTGLPLLDIADKYPDVYFGSVITSDITTKRNFIRFFPRQYQAFYLEGLVAAALTRTGNVGIVSSFPNVEVLRRQAGFSLGVKEAASMLGKPVNLYIKYVGEWYKPTEEREVAATLVSQLCPFGKAA